MTSFHMGMDRKNHKRNQLKSLYGQYIRNSLRMCNEIGDIIKPSLVDGIPGTLARETGLKNCEPAAAFSSSKNDITS